MTIEEIKDLLKFIIRKCDLIINNENYTADEYSQDKVEDIAEMCHRVLDGQFGEIIEPSLPSNLDEAAEKNFETMEVLEHENIFEETHRKIFKTGAKWMAGQCYYIPVEIDNSRTDGRTILSGNFFHFNTGDRVIVQIRKAE